MNPLLLCDFYKTVHAEQYPQGTTKLVSYLTPRTSRIPGETSLILFGLQGFLRDFLLGAFPKDFFEREENDVLSEYNRILSHTLGPGAYDDSKIRRLHALGYLPLKIQAVPEGTRVPIHVPMLEISNTHPDFAWLVNAVETLLSCTLWHTMLSANVGYSYRKLVDLYYSISVDEEVPRSRALGDFSMRGQESLESAEKSSAAFLLSFVNTATVPAIGYLERNYACDCTKEPVAFGSVSTEHSVMCSNFAADGNEMKMVKRLLTEIYPHQSFSMVADSYDYWNLVETILPECKEEILNHDGTLFVRGDSGDPVEIVTKTVYALWHSFGGTVNKKGYKVLNPHIRAIYGDSITQNRARQIYADLIARGFACNNVSLGVGSFSFQCLEQGALFPYTRDTFGIAVKTTYAEINGKPVMLYKAPKTDTGKIKKSQRGLCRVYYKKGMLTFEDGHTPNTIAGLANELQPVFQDGKLVREQSLSEIRRILHPNF